MIRAERVLSEQCEFCPVVTLEDFFVNEGEKAPKDLCLDLISRPAISDSAYCASDRGDQIYEAEHECQLRVRAIREDRE